MYSSGENGAGVPVKSTGDVRRTAGDGRGLRDSSLGPFGPRWAALILFVFLMSLSFQPVSSPQETGISSGSSPGKEVFRGIAEAHRAVEERLHDNGIEGEVSYLEEDWPTHAVDMEEPMEGFSTTTVERKKPVIPPTLFAVEAFKPEEKIGGETFFDTLAYYVYIPFQGNDDDWNLGSLMPSPVSLLFGGDFDTQWVYVDVDNADNDSDDSTGTDVRVRLNPNIAVNSTALSQGEPRGNGGAVIEIDNLGWNRSLEVYIVKPVNLSSTSNPNTTGDVAIISMGLKLPRVPEHVRLHLHAEDVTFIVPQNMLFLNSGQLVNITGPVEVSWALSERISCLTFHMLFIRRNQTGTYDIRSWADVTVSPGWGRDTIPTTAVARGESEDPHYGFNDVMWECEEEVNLSVAFTEDRENTTTALIDIYNTSTYFHAHLSRQPYEGGNLTTLNFTSSERMGRIEYEEYQYLYCDVETIGQDTPLRHVWFEIEDLPASLYMESTVEAGEPLSFSPSSPGGGGMLDALVERVSARFYRVGKTISSIPDKILGAAGSGGYMYLDTESPMNASFLLTDGIKPVVEDRSFFAFYNRTAGPFDQKAVDIIVAGRLKGIKHISGEIGNETSEGEISLLGDTVLYGYYVDENKDLEATVIIDHLPEDMLFSASRGGMNYTGRSGGEAASPMNVKYLSRYMDANMMVDVSGVSSSLSMKRGDGRVSISSPERAIGSVSMLVSNGTARRLPGSHLYVSKTPGDFTLSMSISSLHSLSYDRANSSISVSFSDTDTFRASVYNDVGTPLEGKFVFSPMPRRFSAVFPSSLGITSLGIPDLSPSAGIMSIPNMLFSVSNMGRTMGDMLSGAFSSAVEGLTRNGTKISFSYQTDEPTSLSGYMGYGNMSMDDLPWVHGFSIAQDEEGGAGAKFYLPDLPTRADISADTREPGTSLRMNVGDYSPRYDWFMVHAGNIMGRDADLLIEGLGDHMDMSLNVSALLDMGLGGGRVDASVSASLYSNGTPMDAGMLYMDLRQKTPVDTRMEVLLPRVPSDIYLSASVDEAFYLDYLASTTLPYLYLGGVRSAGSMPASARMVVENLTSSASLSVVPQSEIDLDGSMLQLMPDITAFVGGGGTALYVDADGEFMGQRGRYSFSVTNMSTRLQGRLNGDRYVLDSDGVGYARLQASDVPYSETFSLKEIVLEAKDIRFLSVRVKPLFGFYPVIEIENRNSGSISLLLRTTAWGTIKANIVFMDLAFKRGVLGSIPAYPRFLTNGGIMEMGSVPRHVIIVDPGLTVGATLLGGGWL
ncbi:MAG: hypothetical protein J7L61_04340 [Thermoplasmata archaeon]|nr:hypothetical protein [Thermoplasmata archaeon]